MNVKGNSKIYSKVSDETHGCLHNFIYPHIIAEQLL